MLIFAASTTGSIMKAKILVMSGLLLALTTADLYAQQVMRATRHLSALCSPKGFVLTADCGDKSVVLGYSDGGSFDRAQRNPTFRALLQEMELRVAKRAESGILPTFGPIYKPADVEEEVLPLCSDVWHQYSSPYFDLCPTIDGDTCVAGCVAVAMAQVMRYHRWPITGSGSYSYEDTKGCGQTLSADFSSHHYDWDHMLDEYTGSFTTREGQAVALLMSDCGISVDMNYGTESSGARSVYQPRALADFFGYDRGMMMRFRSFYTQVEWDSIMFHELSEGRPMIVSGWSPGLAHSFVCDGYDRDGLFHVNFGNEGGDANGYYYFTFLTPDQPQWNNYKEYAENGFNMLQSITTGIRPRLPEQESTEQHLYAFSHLEILGDSPQQYNTTDIAVCNLGNVGWNKHEGRVVIALRNSKDVTERQTTQTPIILYDYDRDFLLEEVDDTTYTDTILIQIPQTTADGTYRIVPMYEDNDVWVEARTMVGIPNYLRCEVVGGNATLSQPVNDRFDLKVTAVENFPEIMGHWTRPQYAIRLRNEGSEYSGRMYVALYTDEAPEQNVIIGRVGISLGQDEEARYPFQVTVLQKPPVGIYHLRILADIDVFTDSLVTLYDDPERDIEVVKTLPMGVEDVTDAHTEPTRYDLTGRRITATEPRNRHLPVIEVMNGKGRKILR